MYRTIPFRYGDTLILGSFSGFLKSRSLYFARIAEFTKDPWEATLPVPLQERLRRTPADFMDKFYRLYADRSVVCCWHESEYESVAMWSLYLSGNEGVAFKTSVGRMKAAMRGGPSNLLIARVSYIDHQSEDAESGPEFVPEAPLFCKRRGYEHEREVRAAIVPAFVGGQKPLGTEAPPFGSGNSGTFEFTVTKDWQPDFNNMLPKLPERGGLIVPVDLSILFERIVVSPLYARWAVGALQRIVSDAGVSVPVESSALLQEPARRSPS